MKTMTLFKSVGLGMVAGAIVTAAVMPIDKKRLMRSKAGRLVRNIGNAVETVADSFH